MATGTWQEVAIDEIVRCTPRVVSVFLRLRLPASLAGQHLDLRLSAPDGYQAQRSYSIASAPGAARVELMVELLDDGEVSPWFHDVAEAGDTLEARGPIGGHFVWQPADGGPLLLVGGGSGVVPLLAMLRLRHAAGRGVPTLLLYSARRHDELICADELAAMAQADPSLRLVFVTTREPRRRPDDLDRRLDDVLLRQTLVDWGHAPAASFVCGATPFVEAIASGLRAAGIDAATIRTERYGGA
jgi:ferredoxin-NADP reductase